MLAGVAAVDSEGAQTYVNSAFAAMVGWSKEELIGARPPYLYWPEEEIPAIQAAFATTLRGEAPAQGFELRFRHRSGERIDVQVLISPLEEGRRDAGWVACTYDVTERKRSQLRQRLLAEASSLLATVHDPEATVRGLARLAVPALADWCVVHRRDDRGEIVLAEVAHADPERVELAWELEHRWPLPPDAAVGWPEAVRSGRALLQSELGTGRLAAVAQSPEHLEALQRLGLRSTMVVPLRARGATLGALTLVAAESGRHYGEGDLAVAQELATRAALALDNARLLRQAEQARAAAETSAARLRTLAGASDALASILDYEDALERLAVFCTQTMADYCITYSLEGETVRRVGLSHADPHKRSWVADLDLAGPPALDDTYGAGLVLRTGEPILAPEVSLEMLRGAARSDAYLRALVRLAPRSSIVVPLLARDRRVGAIALAATEDSGRGYGPDDLVLVQELADRAALQVDNARLLGEAQRAVRARDEMLAVVSHDLRTPLQTVLLGCEVLRGQAPVSPDAVEGIGRAARRMDRLVSDLLDVALIEGSGLALDRVPLDVGSLLGEVVDLYRALAEEKRLHLEVLAAAELPTVAADRERLLQALANLVGNAVKFVHAGGTVEIVAESTAGELVLSVRDDGPGISADQLPHVFERFWRTHRRDGGGTGLGLTIAAAVAEAHGGRLEVESVPGRGAIFRLRLPLPAAAG